MDTTLDRHRFDRRMFAAAAVLFPLVILVGFGPTYYLKSVSSAPPLPSLLVHVHGLLMTTWVVLFIAQVRFISIRRIRLHQQLGYAGVGLAALIVMTGLPVALRSARYGSASTPPGIPPLAFVAVPLFDLVVFTLLFAAAVYFRKRPAAHKSLMLLTAINFLPPALGRIQIPALQAIGPLWFFGVPTVLGLACLVLDARRHGRLNRVFAGGLALMVVSYAGRLAVMMTPTWMAFAGWLTGFV